MGIVVQSKHKPAVGTMEVCSICGYDFEGCSEHMNLRVGTREYVTRSIEGYKRPKETKHSPANFPMVGRRAF